MSADGISRAVRPRVSSCANCTRPVVRPYAGPRAGVWLHTDGAEQCTDAYGSPWPDAYATPVRKPGTPTG